MNAKDLAFPSGTFDTVLSGFMGWYDCFDFSTNEFTYPDTKAPEIYRVLKPGGKLVCCSWEEQEDLAWMEAAVLRNHPAMLENPEYLAHRPIGMAYEKAKGYEIILSRAGFRNIEISTHTMTFLSPDFEEWWQQMHEVGWWRIMGNMPAEGIQKIKDAILKDLQSHMRSDRINFNKTVFFISGYKV